MKNKECCEIEKWKEGLFVPNEEGHGYKMFDIIWKDRRRWFFGKEQFSFTKYKLTVEKIYVDSGMILKRRDEIRLYRILDVSVCFSFYDRIFKTGTVIVISSDSTCPKLRIEKIKNAYNVAEAISEYVERERKEKQIRSTEFID